MAKEKKNVACKNTCYCAQCGDLKINDGEKYCPMCKPRIKLGILDGKGGVNRKPIIAG